MSAPESMAITALFATSCLVRIAPAFLSLRFSPEAQRYLERLLPAAVFINFAVYLLYSEMVREPVAALVSLAVVGVIAFLDLLGLIGTAVLGITLYFSLIRILG